MFFPVISAESSETGQSSKVGSTLPTMVPARIGLRISSRTEVSGFSSTSQENRPRWLRACGG